MEKTSKSHNNTKLNANMQDIMASNQTGTSAMQHAVLEAFHTDEQFIAFCEVKCRTDFPLFSSEQIIRMIQLAKVEPKLMPISGSSHLMSDEMEYLCQQARFHIAVADKQAGRKFDETRFRHLRLVSSR